MEEKNFKVIFLGTEYNAWYVTQPETAQKILSEFAAKDCLFAIDTETAAYPKYKSYPKAALSPHLSDIRLIQICDGKNVVVFDLLTLSNTKMFLPLLSTKRFIAHNGIFDLQYFLKMGVQEMNLGCTRILARLIFHAYYPTDAGHDASLEACVEQFLKTKLAKPLQMSDWSEPVLTFEQIQYAALDAIAVLRVAEVAAPGLIRYGLERVYKLYKAAQLPLARMQMNGLKLDVEAHKVLIDKWRGDVAEAEKKVVQITGLKDVTNPKIAEYLENVLPAETLSIWPRTPGGRLSTDAHAFADFSDLEIVKPMLEFQKAATLSSTFGHGLLSLVNPESKRVHCGYNIAGARTGRLSCSKPNFQNFPRAEEFRSIFIANPGKSLLVADYSQVEVRVAAEISQDKNMLKEYQTTGDLYKTLASRLNKKPIQDISKPERQAAKCLVLGMLFGLGVSKFAHYAHKGYGVVVSQEEAESAVNKFREFYPTYREWQLDQAENAKHSLVVTTPCGKRRKLLADDTYGVSMNHGIQGGAAEIMLHSLVDLEKKSRQYNFDLLNTVHDECVISIDIGAEEVVSKVVEKCMTDAYLNVFPNGITNKLVNVGWGTNWAAAK